MAVTWPAKNNYATGDVLTAANMNGIGDDLNDLYAGNQGGATKAAGKNATLNSDFSVWQRGTTFANPANLYTADRWIGSSATAGTITRQTTSDTTNLPNIQYCLRYQRTAASTSTSGLFIAQPFETVNSIPYAGKTITISFYARAGANYSAASSGLSYKVVTGTGTDQNFYTSGYTGSSDLISQTATLTTTWQRFSYSATVATNVTEIGLLFGYSPVGTAGAADYFEITGIQLEQNATATPYVRNGATYQTELAACQRYYETYAGGAAAFSMATTLIEFGVGWKVTKRNTPTLSLIDNSVAVDAYGIGGVTSSGSTIVASPGLCDTGTSVRLDGFTGLTQYRTYSLNQTNTIIAASSEL